MKRGAFLGGVVFGCVLGAGFLAHAALGGSDGVVVPYKGHLEHNGTPVSGLVTLGFDVFNAQNGGTACSSNVLANVAVYNGEFAVQFTVTPQSCVIGQPVWVGTRVNAGTPSEVTLAGRQRIFPTVGALTSGTGDFNVAGTISAAAVTATGAVTGASSAFNSVYDGVLGNVQGAHTQWNRSGFQGETNFVNHHGVGSVGGFNFEDTADGSTVTSLMTLDKSGTIRGATYGFGGMYSVQTFVGLPGPACGTGASYIYLQQNNVFTGAQSCPSGFGAILLSTQEVCAASLGTYKWDTYYCAR